MNIYGCIPTTLLSPQATLTYWAQAASLAGIPPSETAMLASASLSLGLKKSQLPHSFCDSVRKNRSAAFLRSGSGTSDNLPSSFRVTSPASARLRSASIGSAGDRNEAIVWSEDNERLLQLQIHMQMQQHLQHEQKLQQQQLTGQSNYGQHQAFSSNSPPPVGNGLAPLQALCEADVSIFTSGKFDQANQDDERESSEDGERGTSEDAAASKPISSSAGEEMKSDKTEKETLKFGMNRILSEEFGKTRNKTATEPSFQLSNVPEALRSLPLCPCSSAQCPVYTVTSQSLSPVTRFSRAPMPALPSLSAVHALQPPCYPLSSSVDALPGPYSILNSDPTSGSGQAKRKRSWSRAVFSNLQRKGLEKRFEVQKYVTKPDRRQLAAMLGLTDAQVKVWFQNRRMKWRHTQQQQQHQAEREKSSSIQELDSSSASGNTSMCGADTEPLDKSMEESMSEDVTSSSNQQNGLDLRQVGKENSPARIAACDSLSVSVSKPATPVGKSDTTSKNEDNPKIQSISPFRGKGNSIVSSVYTSPSMVFARSPQELQWEQIASKGIFLTDRVDYNSAGGCGLYDVDVVMTQSRPLHSRSPTPTFDTSGSRSDWEDSTSPPYTKSKGRRRQVSGQSTNGKSSDDSLHSHRPKSTQYELKRHSDEDTSISFIDVDN